MCNQIVCKMFGQKSAILLLFGCFVLCTCLHKDEPRVCYNKFEYEYNVLQKLVELEEKMKLQDEASDEMRRELQGIQYFTHQYYYNYFNRIMKLFKFQSSMTVTFYFPKVNSISVYLYCFPAKNF